MYVGFTGTRQGMTDYQRSTLITVLHTIAAVQPEKLVFSHGDCVGADEQAHDEALKLGYEIEIYPPEIQTYRAFCQGAMKTNAAAPYLTRNHNIVRHSNVMIATPKETEDVLRSGTWATVRYALNYCNTLVIFPYGNIQTRPVRSISS